MNDYATQQLGNYRLVRHLGHGGFADVYLGIHVHLKTPAAIKVLHTELTSSDVEKFRTEARTIARLEHPHIVRVLDFGIDGHTPYLVMSYAPNGTLRQHHPKGTTLSLATIVSYVKQIAEALGYAHQQKFIHRDIKPENMLLGRNNEVLLSDFGFVLIAQSSVSQSIEEMAGTVPYMAPEQLQGKPRPASDQYSLGIVVYEWLTGERPFQGSVIELATQHMLQPPTPLRAKNPSIPPEVEEVVLTALAKDPRQRFARVEAFANALEQVSKIVAPNASTSTVSLDLSALPSIGTQPLLVSTPAVLTHNTAPSFQPHAIEGSFSHIPLSYPQPISNVPTFRKSHSQRHLSRREVLLGLAGIAIGSAASSGIWLARSAGLLEGGSLPGFTSTAPLPLAGTTLFTYTGHTGTVFNAAWSPDGYRIASASTDKTVQVWDAATGGKVLPFHGHKDWVYAVAWSPDGKRIASASYDKSVRVWDAFTGQNVLIYPDHTNWVKSVAWSPDGKRIASASHDKTVRVWDAFTGQNALAPLQHTNWVQSVTWSPDGKHIASASGDSVSNGHGDHLVNVWDTTSAKVVYTYRDHQDEVAAVAWSPDGKRIASAGGNPNSGEGDTTVRVWDAFTGQNVLTYQGHTKIVWSVAWAPEGSRIASASRDMLVLVWKAQ